MIKLGHIFAILLLVFSTLVFAGCQRAEGTNPTAEGQEKEENQPDENQPDAEQDAEKSGENEQDANGDPSLGEAPAQNEHNAGTTDENEAQIQDQERYAVHPKHYVISPVPEAGEEYDEKIVLLTFDDTPTGDATLDILDLLDQYEAKAIFFVNGHYAERNLELLHEIKKRGHEIGNHTWWHIYIRKESPDNVREEIVRLNDFLEEHLGERPRYFRPPFGQNSDVSLEIVKEEGMQTMNWSNGSLDWELKTAEAIVEQVLSNMRNGDNILFHDKPITAEALETILQALTEEDYRFVLPTEVILPGKEWPGK